MPGDMTCRQSPLSDSPAAGQGEPLQILVAHDSRVVRAYLQSHLEKAGYGVVQAGSPDEALSLLTSSIRIVILDLGLPEMNGMTCLRHIRERHPDLPVIMISTSLETAHAVQAMKYGAFDYVTKPFDPEKILALIREASRTDLVTGKQQQAGGTPETVYENETVMASRIRRALLPGGVPRELNGLKAGCLNIPSVLIDGDFYDLLAVNETCTDLIMGDVMGKGIPAVVLGASARQHFARALYHHTRSSDHSSLPRPEQIVASVHRDMIGSLTELEMFFTLCYARIDTEKNLLSYVDCGHMRTIHFHHDTSTCTLLQGVNMPLGFPGQDHFNEVLVPFAPGDLFFFYSDGLTEARGPKGQFFGEERLERFIRNNGHLEPQGLCDAALREVAEFSRSESFSDDFTCLAIRIVSPETMEEQAPQWVLDIPADLNHLDRVRDFTREVCMGFGPEVVDEERIKMIQIVATEIVSNIVTHAYRGMSGGNILIEARPTREELIWYFYDRGIEYDFSSAPPPVFDGSSETGFGLHIIAHTADYVRYSRDSTGRNCACVTFFLHRGSPE